MTRKPPHFPQPLDWLARIQIRPLVEQDLPGLEWDGEYIHFRRLFAQSFRDVQRGRSYVWVAVDPPEKLIGQVFIQLVSRVRSDVANGISRAYLYSIRIREGYRNGGLGTRLMDVAEQDLVDRGFSRAYLNVAKENTAGLRFYQRLGYRIVGEEPGRWSYLDHEGHRRHVHEPSWQMEKRL
jgi:ribosomal protein S18 acetylase RimI-like enzyme